MSRPIPPFYSCGLCPTLTLSAEQLLQHYRDAHGVYFTARRNGVYLRARNFDLDLICALFHVPPALILKGSQ